MKIPALQIFYCLLLFNITGLNLQAQVGPYDTIRVMAYNVLNYGFPATESCPQLLTDSKHGWLRTILKYETPDILGLEKMDASPTSFTTDSIIQNVLDSVCAGCYGHADYTNNSGYEKENMLYFKTAKFGFISTTTIYSGDPEISDINLHRLYYKSPSLAITHDTIYLNIILVHLESGSGSADQRSTEVAGAVSWLNNNLSKLDNYIFMGDLNTQSSSESCFQQLIDPANPGIRFYDPANQLGDWSESPTSFVQYLTQSTRTSDPGDCGATGGIDNRYDHILCTQYLMDNIDSVQYIPGSFKVIGQDGQHTNNALIDAPTNTSVPSAVLSALYFMSEHLPVTLQLAIGGSVEAGISKTASSNNISVFPNPAQDVLNIRVPNISGKIEIEIYNMLGQMVFNKVDVASGGNYATQLQLPGLANGMYILRLQLADQIISRRVILDK